MGIKSTVTEKLLVGTHALVVFDDVDGVSALVVFVPAALYQYF